jgi:hypothetical protein
MTAAHTCLLHPSGRRQQAGVGRHTARLKHQPPLQQKSTPQTIGQPTPAGFWRNPRHDLISHTPLTYHASLAFPHVICIETSSFTQGVSELLSDESYAELQQYLTAHPDAGAVIQGTGGLRKIRWNVRGRGKSGGARVIYFHVVDRDQIQMLLIYRKGIKADLSSAEKKILRTLNDGW